MIFVHKELYPQSIFPEEKYLINYLIFKNMSKIGQVSIQGYMYFPGLNISLFLSSLKNLIHIPKHIIYKNADLKYDHVI